MTKLESAMNANSRPATKTNRVSLMVGCHKCACAHDRLGPLVPETLMLFVILHREGSNQTEEQAVDQVGERSNNGRPEAA